MIVIYAYRLISAQRLVHQAQRFPGGEIMANVDALSDDQLRSVTLYAHLTSSDDIMELLMVTDAVKRRIGNTPLHLLMPYIPYARQDRVCNPGEALSIKVFCDLVNAQEYASVTVVDPHSDVAPALLDRCTIIDQSAPLSTVLQRPEFANGVCLVSPDAGASKKVLKLAKNFGIRDVLFADKVRDTATGAITGITVRTPPSLPVAPLLVVDDICDGGRTFIELAAKLREITPAPLYLYVTHGIFSKGVAPLLDHYNAIFTTHDWTHEVNLCVHVISLKGTPE